MDVGLDGDGNSRVGGDGADVATRVCVLVLAGSIVQVDSRQPNLIVGVGGQSGTEERVC